MVNSNIPDEFSKVSYENLDTCINIIASIGKGTLIAKGDILDAYYILKIEKQSYRLLGFFWNGDYYFQKCLPMGLTTSCKEFELFSRAVQWILKNKLNVKNMSHIIDDYMFFGDPNTNDCLNSLNAFLELSKTLGIPIKNEKTVLPTTRAELHGILVDTDQMKMFVPDDKVKRAILLIDKIICAEKVTLRSLQSLAGLLNFLTKVIKSGRIFLRRLYWLTRGPPISTRKIRVTNEIRNDLNIWKYLLTHFNGSLIIKEINWNTPDFKIFSDASGNGYGAVCGDQWICGTFPDIWHDKAIAIKELVPIFLVMIIWHKMFENSNVLFYVDNMSVVSVLNAQTAQDIDLMKMLRKIIVIAMLNNITFHSKHIPGKLNVVCDCISQSQWSKAREWAPWLAKNPLEVPRAFLPW